MSDKIEFEDKPTSLMRDSWNRLKRHKFALISLFVISFYILIALFAPILPIRSYQEQVLEHQNLPPSFNKKAGELMRSRRVDYLARFLAKENRSEYTEAEQAELDKIDAFIQEEPELNNRHYWLGTDALGRDMLSRVIYGSQVSIAIGLLGAILSVFIGVLVGAVAGFMGGKIDYILMRVVDILYGLPYMLIVIILMAILGRNIANLFIALSFVSWLTTARVVRGQILTLKNAVFIEAARSMGASTWRIIIKHLIPNIVGIVIIYTTIRVPTFILMESFLSFLGLGISAPYASWGSLIQSGLDGMDVYPWKLASPAILMSVFLFATNFLGDGLRDAFDPKSKNKV